MNEVDQICLVETYVSMQHYNDSVAVEMLGASPAELDHVAELHEFVGWFHDATPEMPMDNVYDIGRI